MSYFSENLTIMVAKVETIPGTMETLTASDFDFKIMNPTVTLTVEPDNDAAKYANGNHGEDVAVMGIQSGTIGFTLNLAKSSTNLYTAPTWAKFAYGAGLAPVSYSGTGWALQPLKAYDEKTLTIWLYKIQRGASPKATCFKYSGCMGTVTVGGEGTGKPIVLNFSYSGKLEDVDFDIANASIPALGNPDETCYERLLSTAVSIDGYNRLVDTFSLDTGNEVSVLKNMEETTGIDFFAITNRKPRFTCNPLMQGATGAVISDYDYLYGSATGCPTTPEVVVSTNNWTITVPRAQLSTLAPGGRDGISSFDMTWRCLGNGYTGVVADSDLPAEATFELLQGSRTV